MPPGAEAEEGPVLLVGIEGSVAASHVDPLPHHEAGGGYLGPRLRRPLQALAPEAADAAVPSPHVHPSLAHHGRGGHLVGQGHPGHLPGEEVHRHQAPPHPEENPPAGVDHLPRPGGLSAQVHPPLEGKPSGLGGEGVVAGAARPRPGRGQAQGLEARQHPAEEAGVGGALLGVLGQEGQNRLPHGPGHGRVQGLGGLGLLVDVLEEDRLVVLPLKGRAAREGAVEHGPKAVQVGLGGEGRPLACSGAM